MHVRMQNKNAKRMMRLRSSTVEPVLGSLINFTGMRRIYTRRIKSSNKFMLAAAIAYNLKKLLKWNAPKRISVCSRLEISSILTKGWVLSTIFVVRRYVYRHNSRNIFQPLQHSIKVHRKNYFSGFFQGVVQRLLMLHKTPAHAVIALQCVHSLM